MRKQTLALAEKTGGERNPLEKADLINGPGGFFEGANSNGGGLINPLEYVILALNVPYFMPSFRKNV